MNLPARVSVVHSAVSQCDMANAIGLVERRVEEGGGGYVCFTNVHTAVMARRDPTFRRIARDSFLSVADGKPVFWVGRSRGGPGLGHVPGPDFMRETLCRYPRRRHFLYGSTPEVLSRLTESLRSSIPDLNICGTLSPPFRELSRQEVEQHRATIRATGAEFVWVGLGAPKQERWMAENWSALRPAVLLGVGAAFDFHAGVIRRAPDGLRFLGLEWLHRVIQEPRRLWRRYLVTNTLFAWYLMADSFSASDPNQRPD